MAQQTKSLELSLEQRLYWLIVDDGRRFSASSAEALVTMARGHMGGNPLTLGPHDRVSIRGSIAVFAPLIEALQPNVEMTLRLEKLMMSDAPLPLFDLGNTVNEAPWGWFFAQKSADTLPGRAQWQILPQAFAKNADRALHLSSRSTGATLESFVSLKDSVALELGKGHGPLSQWADIRYDVEDATDFARTHLSRSHIGLPEDIAAEIACPYCRPDPYPEWTFKITVADPVSPDFLGEAMARIFEPCRKHLSAPNASITFQGESFFWKPGVGGGLQPRRQAVWERAIEQRS